MMDDELVGWLLAFPGIEAEIGDRLSPAPLPQGETLPAVTYTDISNRPAYTNEGESGHSKSRYQIDIWARTKIDAARIAETVRCLISGYRGQIGKHSIGGVMRQNTFSDYEPDTQLWRVTADYIFLIEV